LVIDDEPGIVHALTRVLQRDGYVVETAGNGRDGLAALQRKRYDVILCDLRMPELDGRAFYTHLRQRAPRLCQRVIFLVPGHSHCASAMRGQFPPRHSSEEHLAASYGQDLWLLHRP
jgi:CheY-like chemotaxis protein